MWWPDKQFAPVITDCHVDCEAIGTATRRAHVVRNGGVGGGHLVVYLDGAGSGGNYRVYRQYLLTYQVARQVTGGSQYVRFVIDGADDFHMKRWSDVQNRMTGLG